jgi:hypothetical protein
MGKKKKIKKKQKRKFEKIISKHSNTIFVNVMHDNKFA